MNTGHVGAFGAQTTELPRRRWPNTLGNERKTEQYLHAAGGGTVTRSRPAYKRKGSVMYTVVRTYSGKGAKALMDVLEKRKKDVDTVMRPVKGFVSYTLARSGDGGFSVTVCKDKAGTDESIRLAKEWVAKNAGDTGVGAPKVLEGSVIIQAN